MKSNLANLDLKNKTVLLRIDANVPIEHGIILNDQRLIASLPTIHYLLDHGARIILLTHIGRPTHQEPELSTQHLVSWFDENGISAQYAPDITALQALLQSNNRVFLLENLRFFPEEKNKDQAFAKQLAQLADFYIDDAFGSLARDDMSMTILPTFFDQKHTSIGLLVEHELSMLNTLQTQFKKPTVLMIGGAKLRTKIALIQTLLPHIDTLLLGPAIVFTFLKALGKPIGNSLVDTSLIPLCHDILMQTEQLNITVRYPEDYIIAEGSFDGPLEILEESTIPNGYSGVSIGPKTANVWSQDILKANATIANGLMGTLKRPESLTYVQKLFQALAQSQGISLVAGGDSAAALYYFDLAPDINYISTGGSATLQYLAQQSLPALEVLKNRAETQ